MTKTTYKCSQKVGEYYQAGCDYELNGKCGRTYCNCTKKVIVRVDGKEVGGEKK
jgi:hypothetical protein